MQVCNATAAAATGATIPNLGSPSSNQVCRECTRQLLTVGHLVHCMPMHACVPPAVMRHAAQL
jgi:hypothetical protein